LNRPVRAKGARRPAAVVPPSSASAPPAADPWSSCRRLTPRSSTGQFHQLGARSAAVSVCEVSNGQRPLELILARNFLTSLSTPGFLVDRDGLLVFYNETAGALLGMSFEDAGQMGPEEWGSAFGPFDDNGERVPFEELPLTRALREGRPAHASFMIRSLKGQEHNIEASALPIRASDSTSGAMVFFWPVAEG
jgi:PAS domain-containing protein